MLDQGLPVALIDAAAEGLSWADMVHHVRLMRPDLLGISVMTPVCEVAYRAARALRPFVRHIVLGGPHPTAMGREVFRECPEADFVATGEGEHGLVHLVRALEGRGGAETVRIPGIIDRQDDGGAAPPPDLDALPLPAVHLLPVGAYRHPLATRLPMFTMVTSRGCPCRCTFCAQSVSRTGWRGHSAERVVQEMGRLEAFGVRYVALYDDNFTADRDRVVSICRGLMENGSRLAWKCEARVDMVDDELLGLLARAGCKTVGFGIETANQAGLDRLRKGTTVDQARNALRQARRHGLETLAYVMVGIPGESLDDVRYTMDFCLAEKVSVIQVATLSALPGTALWEEAREEGWAFAGHVRGLLDDEVSRTTVVSPGWPPARLEAAVAEAQRRSYLRARFAWAALSRCRSVPQVAALVRDTARGIRALADRRVVSRPR